MPIVSTDGGGSGGSTALIGSSSVLGWRQYALSGLASFFSRKPSLKAIGMLSAKAGQGASCAQASSHRERGI